MKGEKFVRFYTSVAKRILGRRKWKSASVLALTASIIICFIMINAKRRGWITYRKNLDEKRREEKRREKKRFFFFLLVLYVIHPLLFAFIIMKHIILDAVK